MDKKTLDSILNSKTPIEITPELIEAAYQSARVQRSEAAYAGLGWIKRASRRVLQFPLTYLPGRVTPLTTPS